MSVSQVDLGTASQLFDTEVTLRYQNNSYLNNTIEERHGTTGIITNIPVSDQIEMSQGSFAPSDIPVTQVDETNVLITAEDFRVKTVIGGGFKTLFAYDKIVDHAKLHAKAAGRLVDYIKIQAIFQSAYFGSLYTVPVNVGANTGMNSDKLADALSQLEANGVDVTGYKVSLWCPALLKKSMMNDQKVTNIFFNAVKPLVNNEIKDYLGTDIRFLGQAGINQIPSTGSPTATFLVPVVADSAIVQTFNRDVSTSITWVPQQDRYELLTVVTTNAGLIQSNGVALITAQNPYAANP